MKPRRSQLSQARRRERLLVVLLGRTWRLAPGLKETQQLREAAHFGSIRKEARNLGTLVVMNDEVHAARLVTKSDTSKPSALCSPTAGPIGFVVEDRVRIACRVDRVAAVPSTDRPSDARVALIRLCFDDRQLIDLAAGAGYQGDPVPNVSR